MSRAATTRASKPAAKRTRGARWPTLPLQQKIGAWHTPLRAWSTYAFCRNLAQPLDAWVELYLQRVANKLLTLYTTTSPTIPSDAAILRALELKRPGKGRAAVNAFRRFAQDCQHQSMALEVAYHVDDGQAPTNAIYLAAQSLGVKEPTVRRAWDKWAWYWERFRSDDGA